MVGVIGQVNGKAYSLPNEAGRVHPPASGPTSLPELGVFAHVPWCYYCGRELIRIGCRAVCEECGAFESAAAL